MGSQQVVATRPLVLEEFIPLKNIGIDAVIDNKPGNASSEKASWMESAQLWNGPAAAETAAKGPQTPKERSEHPLPIDTFGGALDGPRSGNGGGAFLPFTKQDKSAVPDAAAALPELALAPAEKDAAVASEVDRRPYLDAGGGNNGVLVGGLRDVQNGVKPASAAAEGQQAAPASPQTHRKARRCWSPELHRRFVNALQILGGAQGSTHACIISSMNLELARCQMCACCLSEYRQTKLVLFFSANKVATPKQIRELMKVDGLTNDEVKSHLQVIINSSYIYMRDFLAQKKIISGLLEHIIMICMSVLSTDTLLSANSFFCDVLVMQKYRLHTRRPPAPTTPATSAPQLVVLGGIWVPPEYAAQGAAPAIYGAHPATQPHYSAAVAAQEYYSSPAAVHHLQYHPHPTAAMVHHRATAAPPPPHAYKAAMAGSTSESAGRVSMEGGSVGGSVGGRERSESIEEGEEREEEEDDYEEEMAAAKTDGEEAAVKY
jgi:SHAQKYF class myb-like DNA-binding protein